MKKKILYTLCFTAGILLVVITARNIAGKADNPPTNNAGTLIASISPVKFLIDEVSEHRYDVQVLVPTGASPETYEPTPRQIKAVYDSPALFTVGLIDFEQELTRRIAESTTGSTSIIALAANIQLIEGECNHYNHTHAHGTDPHIWSSPKRLKQMARTVYEGLSHLEPAHEGQYRSNLRKLERRLDSLDAWIASRIADADVKRFMIFHPALTYYADDYGLSQIAIEQEGKEPSAEQMKRIVGQAKEAGIGVILYQKEFSPATVETAAADIGARTAEIDPLAENVIDNLKHITELITAK